MRFYTIVSLEEANNIREGYKTTKEVTVNNLDHDLYESLDEAFKDLLNPITSTQDDELVEFELLDANLIKSYFIAGFNRGERLTYRENIKVKWLNFYPRPIKVENKYSAGFERPQESKTKIHTMPSQHYAYNGEM